MKTEIKNILKQWDCRGKGNMERLTTTSKKGGVALTFDLDITYNKSEIMKILKLAEKLKEYEDLEEQGKLLKLPCEIGHVVYRIYQFWGEGAWEIAEHEIRLEDLDNIGKTVFLTRREAENAIKELTN